MPNGSASARRSIAFTSVASKKWGNRSSSAATARDEVIAKYRAWIVRQPALMAALHELHGKDLVCASERCHADVLIELANQ